ncbi:PaaI family thioesterase [Tomitella biformata]|uniref:PaaI family thioesterase n=1 Tax=Tomitella biformata TaxID=630403 RepID=UPI001F2A5BE5|nr:PaaI family thioesterase [Tomitella biformata]
MAALRDGTVDYPPSCGTLEFQITEFSEGSMTLSATPAEYQYNAFGSVHGGVVSTWLDSAMGYAIQTTLALGERFTTLDLNVRFIRPVTAETGIVLVTGLVEHRGRRTSTAQGELRDDRGKLLASATTTGIMFDAP